MVQCDSYKEHKEVEYLKSVKGKLFGIVFNEPVIYTDITHEGDEKETRRKRLLVLVDGSEYEEFEYLKS